MLSHCVEVCRNLKNLYRGISVLCLIAVLGACDSAEIKTEAPTVEAALAPIERQALVSRHNLAFDSVDPKAPLMLGNGSFAMAIDITGLQSFRDQYSAHSPLITQAQWAWHSFPNPEGYKLEDTYRPITVGDETYEYPYFLDWAEIDKNPAISYMRENPHRYSLGQISFVAKNGEDYAPIKFDEVSETAQNLDLWKGIASSTFAFKGKAVDVETSVHPDRDMVITSINSELVSSQDLSVQVAFPYVNSKLNPDPAEWQKSDQHKTVMEVLDDQTTLFYRTLDGTTYVTKAKLSGQGHFEEVRPHTFVLRVGNNAEQIQLTLEYAVSQEEIAPEIEFEQAALAVSEGWQNYWQTGGIVDFTGSTDPRASELERRIILSQYLAAVNTGGAFIPQEEGLYSNSWNGKFHHEMHVWHVAHFLLWNRSEQILDSLDWYNKTLDTAKARAAHYKRAGAWWPKMTGDNAIESPSAINPFIMWQQPHPIYLAELAYRNEPTLETIERYKEVVLETADLLATYPKWNDDLGEYVIGAPIVPVQEVYDIHKTENPTFEVAYFAWGLDMAQTWRERLGLERNEQWDDVLSKMSPLPASEGVYLPTSDLPDFWKSVDRPSCAGGQGIEGGLEAAGEAPDMSCLNRDHPSFLMATGLIPGDKVDDDMMRQTLKKVDALWDFRQTWGWDFPMMAMTATRLGLPDKALDYLMMDAANNQFGITGMTPRYHLGSHGYSKNADTYFPSNGSLLTAVALMVAGWDGASGVTPGFPDDGSWKIRFEDIQPLP